MAIDSPDILFGPEQRLVHKIRLPLGNWRRGKKNKIHKKSKL